MPPAREYAGAACRAKTSRGVEFHLGASERERLRHFDVAKEPAHGPSIWPALSDHERRAFGRGVRKGVKIVFGTDIGGFPWNEIPLAEEFEYYIRWGMTPMRAIKSATSLATELLQMTDDLGAVAPGRYADLVAVARDPLADIRELAQVRFVMKGGTVYVSK